MKELISTLIFDLFLFSLLYFLSPLLQPQAHRDVINTDSPCSVTHERFRAEPL